MPTNRDELQLEEEWYLVTVASKVELITIVLKHY